MTDAGVRTKVALYARVSTDAQAEEGYSIDMQKERLAQYCESRGLGDYELYVDAGFSGAHIDRPAMGRLISDCKKGAVSAVVVYKLDRLSRSQKDTLYLIEDVFLPHGVDFISMSESFDTGTPYGRAIVGLLSVFAQLERDNIRERTRSGMEERVKDGYWMGGGRVPFGYDYDRNKGILVPNSDADTVRKIYDMYIQGYSTYRIADALGLKYERLAIQILRRKSNAGFIRFRGKEYPGRHEPIIPLETYERAMQLMRERARAPMHTVSPNLLTGLVYCGVCGAKMRYQKGGPGAKKLYCYSRQKSKPNLVKSDTCDNIAPWAEDIEGLVLEDLFRPKANIKSPGGGAGGFSIHIADELRGRLSAHQKKLKRLYLLFAEEGADDALLRGAIREEKEALQKTEQRLTEEEARLASAKEQAVLEARLLSMKKLWPAMTYPEKRAILHEIIEKIIVRYDTIRVVYKI